VNTSISATHFWRRPRIASSLWWALWKSCRSRFQTRAYNQSQEYVSRRIRTVYPAGLVYIGSNSYNRRRLPYSRRLRSCSTTSSRSSIAPSQNTFP
jgi:hypothetical protein